MLELVGCANCSGQNKRCRTEARSSRGCFNAPELGEHTGKIACKWEWFVDRYATFNHQAIQLWLHSVLSLVGLLLSRLRESRRRPEQPVRLMVWVPPGGMRQLSSTAALYAYYSSCSTRLNSLHPPQHLLQPPPWLEAKPFRGSKRS